MGSRIALAGGLALAAAGLLLAFAFVRQAIVSETLDDHPEVALRWDPGNVEAMAGAADKAAQAANTDADWRSATGLARRALSLSPMQVPALRVLAWEAAEHGRKSEALALMSLAGRLTQRDNRVHGWLFFRAMERRDWRSAFVNVDPVLRRSSDLEWAFFPQMIDSLGDPAARQGLSDQLVFHPDWRKDLLAELASHGTDPTAIRLTFETIEASAAPLTTDEQSLLINRLIADGDYPAAQAEWRRFLPAPARASNPLLYDGAFQGLPGSPPFNWDFVDDEGAVSEIGSAPDGVRSLHVQYPEARSTHLLQQLVVLAPGAYRLTGAARFDHTGGGEELIWRIDCVEGAKLAEARLGPGAGGWTAFSIDFTTPAAQCAAQRIALASIGQEDFGSREAWVRNLSLTHTPN